MKKSMLVFMAALCAALVACGGGGVSVKDGNLNVELSNTVPTLNALRVIASSVSASGVVSVVDGDFTVEWDSVAVDASTLNLYLSTDAVKSDGDFDLFLTFNPQKNKQAKFRWNASASEIELAKIPQNISAFFNGNPQAKGYIIARACGVIVDTQHGERKECRQKEVAVVMLK